MKLHTGARIEGLDVLRGVAILLVLLRHSWGSTIVGGGGLIGVVIFFTLSGYLITGLLMSDLRRYGRVRYGRFYRNRAIRLLPALMFVLIGFVIVEGILNVSGTGPQVLRTALVAVTYTMNVPGFSHGSGNMSHLWTLANEEQFYLVWPLLLALGLRFRRLRLVVAITAALIVVANFVWLALVYPHVGLVYPAVTTWTIAMIIGAAAQLGQHRISRYLRGRSATIGGVAGAAGLLGLALIPNLKDLTIVYVAGGATIGLLAVLVIWKLREVRRVPFAAKPLLALGIVSYAAYLWNYPITWWLRDAGIEHWEILAFVFTLIAATVSWVAVERPFNALKSRMDRRAHLASSKPVFAGDSVGSSADVALRAEARAENRTED